MCSSDLIADVSIGMVGYRSVFHFIERFGPGGYGLGFEGLQFKGSGHLGPEHALYIAVQVHFLYCVADFYPDGDR